MNPRPGPFDEPSPLRVLMVLEPVDGGAARHVGELCQALRRKGLGIHLACPLPWRPTIRDQVAALQQSGIGVTYMELGRRPFHVVADPLAIVRLRRLIQRVQPHVVHLHSSKAGALGRLAITQLAAVPGRPAVVYTPHAFAFLDRASRLRSALYLWAERLLGRWTDCVVAVSSSEGKACVSSRIMPAERTAVIPNGVARMPRLRSEARRDGPLRIGWLGRLVRQKQPEAIIQTASILSRRGVDFELVLAGDGEKMAVCERLVRESRIQGHVFLAGFVEDPEAFYGAIDVFCHSSQFEGLPYAVLGAMSWALPVVAFDVPGVRDIVTHGETGLLAADGDVEGLASHLAWLEREPELRGQLGEAGRCRVRRDFRLDRQIESLLGVYQDLVGAGRPATTAYRHL